MTLLSPLPDSRYFLILERNMNSKAQPMLGFFVFSWLSGNNACPREEGIPMITTTTHAIEGRQITAYLDIVSAESVQGVNVIRDMFAGMRDFFGGRSQTLERALKEARIQATDEIKERARALQADAVVGLDFEISMPGGKGGMVVVFVTGTAVKLR
ncbi:hypothetical protein EMIT0P294_30292 [Pseudomonas sp. IT-P294]|jgi:uncharacterized protein YbjQ (UPF0145 family)